jgi:hypothetical protein
LQIGAVLSYRLARQALAATPSVRCFYGYNCRLRQIQTMSLITYLVDNNQATLDKLMETLQELVPVRIAARTDKQAQAGGWLGSHGNHWQAAIVGILATCRQRESDQKGLVFTNYAAPDIRRRAIDPGADRVFDKSVALDSRLSCCADLYRQLRRHVASVPAEFQNS